MLMVTMNGFLSLIYLDSCPDQEVGNYIANELFHQVHLAALESQEVSNNPTRPKRPLYTEGHSDIFKGWDSPDGIFWKEATDKEYYILEDKKISLVVRVYLMFVGFLN